MIPQGKKPYPPSSTKTCEQPPTMPARPTPQGGQLRFGAIYGYRLWTVEKGELFSPYYAGVGSTVWQPGQVDASCRIIHFDETGAPLPRETSPTGETTTCGNGGRCGNGECSCGLYAALDLEGAAACAHPEQEYVLGVVRGYGQVTQGSKAWKAEHMEIVCFLHPLELQRRQRRRVWFSKVLFVLSVLLPALVVLLLRSFPSFNAPLGVLLLIASTAFISMTARNMNHYWQRFEMARRSMVPSKVLSPRWSEIPCYASAEEAARELQLPLPGLCAGNTPGRGAQLP